MHGLWRAFLAPARMEVDCSGGELSCNGSAALLLMLAEQVWLFERASECFMDHRDPSKVAHPLVALLGQQILGLALGYEDVNDHDELRRDRVLSTAMGRVECARSDCEPLTGKSTLNHRMELSANGARCRSGWCSATAGRCGRNCARRAAMWRRASRSSRS